MKTNIQKAHELLHRYLAGDCTEEEKAQLEAWYAQYQAEDLQAITEEERMKRLEQIRQSLPVHKKPGSTGRSLWYALAACIAFVAIAVSLYLHFKPGNTDEKLAAKDILPGGNRAVLKLADGRLIPLSGSREGIVIKAGELIYDDGSEVEGLERKKNDGLEYTTISTPKGGQYRVQLADGTKVWLNAESSLTYPGKFIGEERRVQLSGEAYFEVAHQAVPFRVQSRGQLIEVLGTHFNVTAYADQEAEQTTLLEGKVRVSRLTPGAPATTKGGLQQAVLSPGQQASLWDNEFKIVNDADLEEVIAWKEGYFKFGGSLENIMDKISRWYNVDVVYQDDFGGKLRFVGKISRSKRLSEILNIIELSGNLHFKVEGRRVTVMK